MKNIKKTVFFACLAISFTLTDTYAGDEPTAKNVPTAEEFLNTPMDKAFPMIARLNKEQAKELVTQIRAIARKEYSDIDKVYFLLSHLEEIQAVEKEQARLKSLLWVYALGFLLFSGFLGYIILAQRKAIREFQRNIK